MKAALDAADGGKIASAAARGDTFDLDLEGETVTLHGDDVLIETSSAEGYSCAEDAGYLTALDTSLNDALIREGFAREVVRSVQDARKQADLQVSDRIVLGVSGSDAIEAAIEAYRDLIMAETLATTWQIGQPEADFSIDKSLGDDHWRIEISLEIRA